MRDVETDHVFMKFGKGKDINKAIDIAKKCLQTEIVEYGINFT